MSLYAQSALTPTGRTDFNGSFDQFWQFGSDGGTASTFPGWAELSTTSLCLTSTETPDNGGYADRFWSCNQQNLFTDVRMTGTFNPNGDEDINDTMGLLVPRKYGQSDVLHGGTELLRKFVDHLPQQPEGVVGGTSNLATATIEWPRILQTVFTLKLKPLEPALKLGLTKMRRRPTCVPMFRSSMIHGSRTHLGPFWSVGEREFRRPAAARGLR